jgi:TIR domain
MAGMSKIFISYRREDSAEVCGRMYDWLTNRLPPENVYKDVDAIPFGADFMQHVGSAMRQSDVMLLVIGLKWLVPGEGVSPYVRMEIELALQYHVKIIPVLVHDATMPAASALPPSIQSIVALNGNTVHALDPYFHIDMERLAPDLGIGKKTPARGGSYWGITRPRYLVLSLFALATCIGSLSLSVVIAEGFLSGGSGVGYSRWLRLTDVIFIVAALPTLVLFLVRALGKNWRWLFGFLLAFVPGILVALLQAALSSGSLYVQVGHKLTHPLDVGWSLLLSGMPAFLILTFAVFGPSLRARQVFLWALLLVVVLLGCYTVWVTAAG